MDRNTSNDGLDSAKAQTTDGQATYREYTVTGPAVVDFWWKVSSEKSFDTFTYSLNGVSQETISGEVDWTYRTLTLPEGTHTIRWTYAKDESGAIGQDAGWLDEFAVYPATATLRVRDGVTLLDTRHTVDFGSTALQGAAPTKTLTFSNEGYVPLEVQLSLPEGSPFTFENNARTYDLMLGRGESADVPISLATDSAGTKTALLSISAPGSSTAPPIIALQGILLGQKIGVAQGGNSVVSGRSVDMGLAPRTLQFTLGNTGNVGNLVISQISATGNFQIIQQPQTTIAPQGSTSFTVLAQAAAFGSQSGVITINSNDPDTPTFTISLSATAFAVGGDGIRSDSMATSGSGGAVGWGLASTQLPSGVTGQALKTGTTPNNGGSVLEFTSQTAGVVKWSWKVSTQEEFDWLLCEVDGQEAAGISTKNGIWQTQVVNVPAGANIRWVYRKDGSGSIGEDAGYLADVEFRSFAANQSFSQWAQTHGIYDPQQRMPKSGMQAMFGWLGGFGVDGENTDDHHAAWILSGRLTYRYPISKTADGTQQILFSSDMSAWTPRRVSQRILSEDGNRMVVEATAPSGTKGFFKVSGGGDTSMVWVQGGLLPQSSELAGTAVATFQIGKTEVTWAEWQEVRLWGISNGYSDLAGVGEGSAEDHPVRTVRWIDAVKWCNAKSEMHRLQPVYYLGNSVFRTGQTAPTAKNEANGYRLPSEAEWEWAAGGGVVSQGYTYSGSNDLNAVGWYFSNATNPAVNLYDGRGTFPAGRKMANELGIHDMSGNVWEWCFDPIVISPSLVARAIRGSSFAWDTTRAAVAYRAECYAPITYLNNSYGFRLARNAVD
jgi:formylglycine-generating enzyme required for sulfatase activity